MDFKTWVNLLWDLKHLLDDSLGGVRSISYQDGLYRRDYELDFHTLKPIHPKDRIFIEYNSPHGLDTELAYNSLVIVLHTLERVECSGRKGLLRKRRDYSAKGHVQNTCMGSSRPLVTI